MAGSQVPPFWQRQLWLQLVPKVPAGQAGEGEGDGAQPGHGLAGLHSPERRTELHSLWLHSTPVQPAAQRQPLPSAPQAAPFWQSSQVRLQSGPNVCSRHTATTGTTGEKLPEAAAAPRAVWSLPMWRLQQS